MAAPRQAEFDLQDRLRRLNEIGVALSVERSLDALLERILQEARSFTRADAGTLYLKHGDRLVFEVAQNDTLKNSPEVRYGASAMPPVPVDRSSVSGYAAVTGETLNIADVYADARYRFEGPQQYDRRSGYRTKSMLVVPMRDHENQTVGVLQLINALEPGTGRVVPFSGADQALVSSLASQAAVAVNNVRLVRETEALFDAFVRVMATALDQRSPYTGGHVRRVAEMALILARAVNACQTGPLAGVRFDAEALDELRVAAWMHDIGKITTPDWIVDKPTKLTTVYDRIDLLRTRFACIRSSIEKEILRRRLQGEDAAPLQAEQDLRLREVADDLAFLERANLPGEGMSAADLARLQTIAARNYAPGEQTFPSLRPDELYNLSIRRGSLTEEERQKINDHAAATTRMLSQIPFTRRLARVPAIAGAHHERLDGSGYPRGLTAAEIPLQARILALVDVFESLSADDRPYRQALPPEAVLGILQAEVQANHLDGALLELFRRERLYSRLEGIKEEMRRERQSCA